jgi:hypothetical protein
MGLSFLLPVDFCYAAAGSNFNTPLICPMPLHKLLSARSGKAGVYLGFIWGLIKRINPKHNQTPQKNKPLKTAL